MVNIGGGTHDQFLSGLRYGLVLGEDTYGHAYLTYNKQDSSALYGTGEEANDNWERLRTGFRLNSGQEDASS